MWQHYSIIKGYTSNEKGDTSTAIGLPSTAQGVTSNLLGDSSIAKGYPHEVKVVHS